MEDGERVIEGDENLVNHATSYYKTLFGPDIGNTFPLDPSLWNNDEKVSEEDNSALIKPFTEEEIKFTLFKMEKNKAIGPDKIPPAGTSLEWILLSSLMSFIKGIWMSIG